MWQYTIFIDSVQIHLACHTAVYLHKMPMQEKVWKYSGTTFWKQEFLKIENKNMTYFSKAEDTKEIH